MAVAACSITNLQATCNSSVPTNALRGVGGAPYVSTYLCFRCVGTKPPGESSAKGAKKVVVGK